MENLTIVDGGAALIIIISAILAFSRGLVRELMAILGWIGAAIAAYYFAPGVQPLVKELPVLPLRLITYIGLIASFISFILGTRFIILKLLSDIKVAGFTAIMVAITFSAGLLMFSLGIIGEYISRIYISQTQRPIYSVEKSLIIEEIA